MQESYKFCTNCLTKCAMDLDVIWCTVEIHWSDEVIWCTVEIHWSDEPFIHFTLC